MTCASNQYQLEGSWCCNAKRLTPSCMCKQSLVLHHNFYCHHSIGNIFIYFCSGEVPCQLETDNKILYVHSCSNLKGVLTMASVTSLENIPIQLWSQEYQQSHQLVCRLLVLTKIHRGPYQVTYSTIQ